MNITISRQATASGGQYDATLDDGRHVGELTYRVSSPGVVNANHTGVAPDMQGHGIAAKLVERLIADARAEGFRIIPSCSYVAAQRRRHPDWEALFV